MHAATPATHTVKRSPRAKERGSSRASQIHRLHRVHADSHTSCPAMSLRGENCKEDGRYDERHIKTTNATPATHTLRRGPRAKERESSRTSQTHRVHADLHTSCLTMPLRAGNGWEDGRYDEHHIKTTNATPAAHTLRRSPGAQKRESSWTSRTR